MKEIQRPKKPLQGIRVLDWTAGQAGPIATSLMADMGPACQAVQSSTLIPSIGFFGIFTPCRIVLLEM